MKTYFLSTIVILSLFLSSCSGAAATQAPPAATEAPAATGAPPAATEAPAKAADDVVILVVDDFTLPDPGRQVYKDAKDDENCIVKPDGQTYGASGASLGGENPMDSSGATISHGDSVYNDIVKQATTLSKVLPDQMIADPNFPWLKRISIWDTGEGKLIIVGVDTAGYTTTSVSGNITSAISSFENGNGMDIALNDSTSQHINQISQFVINMSFAIVPCKTANISLLAYQSLLQNDQALAGLEQKLRNTLASSRLSEEEKAKVVLIGSGYSVDIDTDNIHFVSPKGTVFSDDPLYGLLNEQKSNSDIVFVASAGNLGQYFEFPFAPAIWDFVISVSAEGANSGSVPDTAQCFHAGINDYSNCGEIKMNGVSLDQSKNTGTSYAAPKFSYEVALFLMENKFSQCTGPNTTALSVFGYAGDTGNWKNLGFDDAFNDLCILGTPTP